jgi:hypothetical protein
MPIARRPGTGFGRVSVIPAQAGTMLGHDDARAPPAQE